MLGAFKWDPRFVVVAGLGVILSAVYMLWMFQRVYYGEVTDEHNRDMPDLSFREWAIVGPLARHGDLHGRVPERVPEADGAGGRPHRPARAGASAASRATDARGAAASCDLRTRPHLTAPVRTCRHPTAPVRTGTLAEQLAMFSTPSTPSSRSSASPWPAWSCCSPSRSAARTSACRSAGCRSSAWSAPASASVLLVGPQRHQLRRRDRRQLRALRQPRDRRRRHPHRVLLVADGRARRPAGGRVLRARCCSRSSA